MLIWHARDAAAQIQISCTGDACCTSPITGPPSQSGSDGSAASVSIQLRGAPRAEAQTPRRFVLEDESKPISPPFEPCEDREDALCAKLDGDQLRQAREAGALYIFWEQGRLPVHPCPAVPVQSNVPRPVPDPEPIPPSEPVVPPVAAVGALPQPEVLPPVGAGPPGEIPQTVVEVAAKTVSSEEIAADMDQPPSEPVAVQAPGRDLAGGAVPEAAPAGRPLDGDVSLFPVSAVRDRFADVVAVADRAHAHCSGIFVGPRHVLTARHCLPATHVLYGSDADTPLARIAVIQILLHPSVQVDAAILVLQSGLGLPIRPRRGYGQGRPPRGMARVVGFGANDPAGRTGFGHKREVDIPVASWGCDPRRAARVRCVPGLELVTTRFRMRDSCRGDSGGPLLELHANVWRVVAITSRPVARGELVCGSGGVYVRMDQLAPWIDQALIQTLPDKDVPGS